MCRLVIFAKPDNDHPDPALNARKFKRGMVVDILPDGAHPGNEVLTRGWWRVVDVPGPREDYEYLLGSDPAFHQDELFLSGATFPRKRVHLIDLAAVGDSVQSISTVTLQAEALINPTVIGVESVG